MRKIINGRALLIIALGLIFGILFGKLNTENFNLIFLIFPIGIILVTFAFAFIFRKDYTYLKDLSLVALVLCVCFVCGFTLFDANTIKYDKAVVEETKYMITGKVTSFREYDKYLSIVLSNLKLNNDESILDCDYNLKVYAYYDDSYDFDVGNVIKFESKIKNYNTIYNGKLNNSLILDKIKYCTFVNLSAINKISYMPNLFERINIAVRDKLKNSMEDEEFGLSYAMLTGNVGYVTSETLEKFRAAGVAHIFAVSGLHIGFLSALLFFAMKKLNKRFIKFIIINMAMFFYTGICGFTPSCVRAAVMCGVYMLADLTGKKYDFLNSILLSGIILLLVSPMYLFDIGFILSYTCVLSIAVLGCVIKRALKFLPDKLNSSLSVILAVQIGIFPFILEFFNRAPLLNVLLNFLLIPIISIVFTILLLALILSFIFPFASGILAFPSFLIKLVRLFVTQIQWDYFTLSGIKFGIYALAYYCILILCSFHIYLPKTIRITLITIMLILLILGIAKNNLALFTEYFNNLNQSCYNYKYDSFLGG